MDKYNLEITKSLLQKAVRRADVELTEIIVKYLISIDEFKWLKSRLAVIAYEECWTFGSQLYDDQNKLKVLEQYLELAATVKNKNAAGLATLASKYHDGEWKALVGNADQKKAIKSVANAIGSPNDFWEWVRSQKRTYNKHHGRIESAKRAVTKCKFETDKAMIYAVAYFAIKDEVPKTVPAQPQHDPNFPYWVAIDKHTTIGKEAFIDAYKKIDLLAVRGQRIAFYLEGSKCNQIMNSPYWDLSKDWQLNRMGYTITQIHAKWNELKPILIELTKRRADEVKNIIEKPISDTGDSDQLSLL